MEGVLFKYRKNNQIWLFTHNQLNVMECSTCYVDLANFKIITGTITSESNSFVYCLTGGIAVSLFKRHTSYFQLFVSLRNAHPLVVLSIKAKYLMFLRLEKLLFWEKRKVLLNNQKYKPTNLVNILLFETEGKYCQEIFYG